jgi:hypothetical protein
MHTHTSMDAHAHIHDMSSGNHEKNIRKINCFLCIMMYHIIYGYYIIIRIIRITQGTGICTLSRI